MRIVHVEYHFELFVLSSLIPCDVGIKFSVLCRCWMNEYRNKFSSLPLCIGWLVVASYCSMKNKSDFEIPLAREWETSRIIEHYLLLTSDEQWWWNQSNPNPKCDNVHSVHVIRWCSQNLFHLLRIVSHNRMIVVQGYARQNQWHLGLFSILSVFISILRNSGCTEWVSRNSLANCISRWFSCGNVGWQSKGRLTMIMWWKCSTEASLCWLMFHVFPPVAPFRCTLWVHRECLHEIPIQTDIALR